MAMNAPDMFSSQTQPPGGMGGLFRLFDDLSDAILACNPEGRIIYTNAPARQLLGHHANELLALSVQALFQTGPGLGLPSAGENAGSVFQPDPESVSKPRPVPTPKPDPGSVSEPDPVPIPKPDPATWFPASYGGRELEFRFVHDLAPGPGFQGHFLRIRQKTPVKNFAFTNPMIQEHFNGEKWMDSDKYPAFTFKGNVADIKKVNMKKDGMYTSNVEGVLTVKGKEQKIKAPATFTVKGGKVVATTAFSINLADYGISGAPIEGGKVAKEPKVTVAATF